MNIERVEMDGYEADDIIGTHRLSDDKKQTLIVTGDRDVFQLISSNVHVLITRKGISETEEFDKEKLLSQYNVTPEQVVDLKGLMGDASDNIPGIPGVGEKTALALLKQFGSIENMLKNTAEIKRNKIRENVESNIEIAKISKELATIDREMPLEVSLDKYIYKRPDFPALIELYKKIWI